MVNKDFQHNPQYWTTTHRSWSEATRDAQYACGIYVYQEDTSAVKGTLVACVAILSLVALAIYFDNIVEALR